MLWALTHVQLCDKHRLFIFSVIRIHVCIMYIFYMNILICSVYKCIVIYTLYYIDIKMMSLTIAIIF